MLYPMTFEPILKQVIWGGSDICPFKGITPVREGIGESWELSHVKGNCSVVAQGPLAGKTLDELIRTYGGQLLGTRVMERFGTTFPLLIKFIDARADLSIQVHPDDALAEKRHHSWGKTEMWYVVKAAPGAGLYSGFAKQIDADEYVKRVGAHTITEVLQHYEVNAGDVFFLPAGRVHAIGAGCFITEIQQTSDITYRIYDYGRKGADGKERELHTELAKDAIDYTVLPDYRTHYKAHTNATVKLADCRYFTVGLLDINAGMIRDFAGLDSFVVYICMEGMTSVRDDKGNEVYLHQGQTLLLPADTGEVTLSPVSDVKLLEAYIG